MNRVKRLFGIGGILVLILVLLVMMTSAETNIVDEGQCGEQVYWVLDNQGVLTISGSGDMYDYGTDWNWDGHRENIISAVITDGVTSIGNTAFYYCSNLTSVNIPESVTKIGHDAFFYCSSMTNINIPNGVTRIEDWTFSGCSSLSDIIIPNGVTSIGQEAFADCNNLTSIFIPDSVVSIGNAAFTSCDKITDVIVSNGFISEYAFSFCDSLKSVTIADGGTGIDQYAFLSCGNLEKVTIPQSVIYISENAFDDCSPSIYCDEYSYVDSWATKHGLSVIYLGSAGSTIVDSGKCGDQVYWTLDDQGLLTVSGSGSMYDNLYGLEYQKDIISVVITDGVTSIGSSAFYDCSSLTSINIPDGVTSISNSAFRGCSKLTSINIPDGVTSIDSSAFYDCSSLTSITIPDSVTSIGTGAFYYCSSLTSITVPDSVTSIGYCAFYGCSSLTSINIPEGVTSIGDYAFNDCSSLTSITIPDSVTSIGYSAFSCCSKLTSINIPDGVTSIGDDAFFYCSSLTSINIPDGVTSIGEGAFSGCSSLTSINIPDGVTIIGNCTFYCCFGLQKIAIPESVVCIYENAFTNSYPTVYCYEFSYADGWATEEGMTICYLDSEPLPVQMQLPESSILPKGQTATMLVNIFPDGIYDLVWTSSDPSIVSVDNGKLTGHAKGTVTITVSCTRNDESELEASSLVTCYVPLESFTLCPAEVWVVAKESYQVQPVIVPTDAEEPFTWKSSNTAIATVSELGLVTTKAVGDVTITATSRSGLTQTMLLHCCYPVLSIAFEPAELQMSTDPVQLQATVTDTKGGTYVNKLITFTTSDPDIVTIDENGMLYPHKAGTAEITATSSNGKTATCTVTVGVDGHIPVTTIEAIDPTCTADGRTERIVCSDCGAVLSESVIIPALGHDTVTHEAQEPTCTDIGWNAYETCSRCDYSTYVEIPALEHDIQAYEVQEPTCTEDGHEAYEACSRCDYTTCVIIPALGHDTVTHEAQAPTCTEIGWKAYETCSRCDYSTYAELPALGHTVVTDSYIAPTRTTGGMTAGSHCSVCNEILEGNEYIAPLSDAPIVIVPEAVEGLGEEAYMGSGVVCVRLPDGCKYLGSRAFAQCTSLQVIEIPASVTDIATDAFEGTTGFVIITGYNSTAMNYAKEHNIRCQIDTWPTTD